MKLRFASNEFVCELTESVDVVEQLVSFGDSSLIAESDSGSGLFESAELLFNRLRFKQ